MSRLRNFVFTINNYTDVDLYQLNTLEWQAEYLVYGFEVGESGTPHVQGYCELKSQQYFNRVKEWLPRAYLAARRGSQKQAIDYCKKDGEFWEYGQPKQQGARNDLHELMQAVQTGQETIEIMELYPETYSTKQRFVDRYRQEWEKTNTRAFRTVETEVIWSEKGGIGKTKAAHDFDPKVFTVNPEDAFPFDGYDGEKTILIDDFEGQGIKYKHLLKILDGHQYRCNVKGGHRYAQWTKVFITANKPPAQWYHHGLTQPLARRLTTITHMSDNSEVGGNIRTPTSEHLLLEFLRRGLAYQRLVGV